MPEEKIRGESQDNGLAAQKADEGDDRRIQHMERELAVAKMVLYATLPIESAHALLDMYRSLYDAQQVQPATNVNVAGNAAAEPACTVAARASAVASSARDAATQTEESGPPQHHEALTCHGRLPANGCVLCGVPTATRSAGEAPGRAAALGRATAPLLPPKAAWSLDERSKGHEAESAAPQPATHASADAAAAARVVLVTSGVHLAHVAVTATYQRAAATAAIPSPVVADAAAVPSPVVTDTLLWAAMASVLCVALQHAAATRPAWYDAHREQLVAAFRLMLAAAGAVHCTVVRRIHGASGGDLLLSPLFLVGLLLLPALLLPVRWHVHVVLQLLALALLLPQVACISPPGYGSAWGCNWWPALMLAAAGFALPTVLVWQLERIACAPFLSARPRRD